MPDDEQLADVVPIHPDRDLEDDDAPVSSSGPRVGCRHLKIKLDRDAHRGYCRDCDAEVDLFDFLCRLAGDWERYARHRREAQRRASAAQERLQETLRLERNARARAGKLGVPRRDLPAVPWGEAGR